MKRGGETQNEKVEGTRGLSPQIGVVLLFGMVFIGITLIAVMGFPMFGFLEAESEAEQTRMVVDEDDHCISTALFSGEPCVVHSDQVSTDGVVEVEWWGKPDESNETVGIEPLGALEYELSDRTYLNQGGGVWEVTDNGDIRVLQSPNIGYNGDVLNLNLRKTSASAHGSGKNLARPDHEWRSAFDTELEEASESGHPNVTITVESEFHEAWNAHFEDAFAPDEYENVSVFHESENDRVSVTIIDITPSSHEGPIFEVSEDQGVAGKTEQVVENGEQFDIEAVITNLGDETHSQQPNATIDPNGFALENQQTVNVNNLNPGDSETVTFNFPPSNGPHQYGSFLEAGNTYEYVIATENDRTDDPSGSFYFGESGSVFELEDPTATVDENVTITADLQNVGVEDDTRMVILTLEHNEHGSPDGYTNETEVERAYGESDDVTWTMNRSLLLEGDYTYTIETEGGDEPVSGEFTVNVGVDPSESELEFDGTGTVNVSLLGAETSTTTGSTDLPPSLLPDADRDEGVWLTEDNGGWSYDLENRDPWASQASEPSWSGNGGWLTDGTLECIDEGWWGQCTEYGFVDASEFHWSDDEGYDIDWANDDGDWSWSGNGQWEPIHHQNLIPIDLEVVFEDRDTGDEIARETPWVDEDENINTREMRHEPSESELSESYEVSNVVMTISATSYGNGFSCNTGWTEPSLDDPYRVVEGGDGWQEGGEGFWFDRECESMNNEWESVDVAGGEGDGQVRVRSKENNTMPELRGYHPGQKSADQVLPSGMYTGKEDEDGNPLLDLTENEFLYLFEVTTNPEAENVDSDSFFEEAQGTDGSGDPNFNDIIVHVEVVGSGSPTDIKNPFDVADPGAGDPPETGLGDSDTETGSTTGSSGGKNVEVGADHIVIG